MNDKGKINIKAKRLNNANPNYRDTTTGNTFLMVALEKNNLVLFKTLIEKGANTGMKNAGKSVKQLALEKQNKDGDSSFFEACNTPVSIIKFSAPSSEPPKPSHHKPELKKSFSEETIGKQKKP